MNFALTDKQKEFWHNATHRWNIKEGATRSGKTFLDYFWIAKRITETRGEGLIAILGNTQGTINRNILEPMRNIWGDSLISTIGTDAKCTMFGKKVYVLGADKASQVSKLQGAGIEYCYGDEVTTWNKEVFAMLKSRLDKPHSVFDGTCNPDNPNHWFLEFLKSDADIYRQKYKIDDNKFLSDAFVASLKKEYEGTVYYKRFILGEWALADGLVYPMFSETDNVIDNADGCQGLWYISIDYGTLNPTSMGLWCTSIQNHTAIRVAEYYYDARKEKDLKTDEEYYDELVKLAGNHIIQSVIVDPSAASFITTIRRHGKFTVRKANNSVLDGIRVTTLFLKNRSVLIHKSCVNSIREFKAYSWDDKAPEDKVIKENDHAMDDIRYFCKTILERAW